MLTSTRSLFGKSATDASRIPALIKETERPLGSVCADGAYDNEGVYKAVEVGIEMAGGPGTVSARFALEVMESVFSK